MMANEEEKEESASVIDKLPLSLKQQLGPKEMLKSLSTEGMSDRISMKAKEYLYP